MKKSLASIRKAFDQKILDGVWAAWAQMGAAGKAPRVWNAVVDLEPLLLLTWQVSRSDPRVFDEVLDWLTVNGRWVNVTRLATLAEQDAICDRRMVGAVAAYLARNDATLKWKRLAETCRPSAGAKVETLFRFEGNEMVAPNSPKDPIFRSFGLVRGPVELRHQSQVTDFSRPPALFLKCRALFGLSIRADLITALAARGPLTGSRLARELGYSQRRVQDALVDMNQAGFLGVRNDANRKEYFLDERVGWRTFLGGTFPKWFDWWAFGRASARIRKGMRSLKEEGITDYILDAEISRLFVMDEVLEDLTMAGVRLPKHGTAQEIINRFEWIPS
jgi:biotin operon repressor